MNWAGLGNSFQLFVGYFLLAVVSTVAAVRFAKPGWRKWAAGLGTFGVFWGLTLIDDVMGAREHRVLCEKEAGVKVYKQAKLPSEFYLQNGRPKFIDEGGNVDQLIEKKLQGYIKFERKGQDSYSLRYLKIDKLVTEIVDTRTGELLAKRVDFHKWPSPFVPSILHGGAIGCNDSTMNESYLKLYRQTFPSLVTK